MIASSSSTVQVTGALPGEHIAVEFDPDGMPHIQSILINMYSDPEMAALREIACNARDATVEAGSDRAIEVTSPTPLSSFLKIRDFGCGLGIEDIRNIFSKIGASTKRNTNDQTGCLGIGSKSPLAYAPQFTVSSVKDGRRVEVAISLVESGAAEMQVVEETASDEPNGTEVVIPAKRHNSMATKARALFSMWPEGSVLLDGTPVDQVAGHMLTAKPATVRIDTPDAEQPHRDVLIEKMLLREGTGGSVVVMGGVPYAIQPEDNHTGLSYNQSIVVWVGMGQVDFAPPRESLRKTVLTKQTLKAIHEHFEYAVPKAIQRAIDAAPTAGEALRAMLKWTSLVPERVRKDSYTYQGRVLPEKFKLDGEEKMVVLSQRPSKLSSHSRYNSINAETASQAVWLYNYDKPTFSAGQRKKVDFWATQQWPSWPYAAYNSTDVLPEHFILVEKKPDTTFLDSARVLDWKAVIDPIRLPRSSGGGSYGPTGRIAGSYDFYAGGAWNDGVPGDDIDTSYPVYYYVKDRWTNRHDAESYVNMLNHFEPDSTVVILTVNRVDKFLRIFEGTMLARDRCLEIRQDWIDTVDEPTQKMIAFHDAVNASKYESLRPHGPFRHPAIQATMDMLDKIKSSDALTTAIKERNMLYNSPSFETDWEDPITETHYPLACRWNDGLVSGPSEHIAKYINAVYVAPAKVKA